MIHEIILRTDPRTAADNTLLKRAVGMKLRLSESEIHEIRIVRRSIDARQRNVMVNVSLSVASGNDTKIALHYRNHELKHVGTDAPAVVIVGAGPAGLFGALRALELGIRPIVIERGKDVDSRRIDIAALTRSGCADPDSNYCFGEGGAGTFSDGKLFTRSKKRGNVEAVLELLCQYGASHDILVDAHPHIGSDRLPAVIKNIREAIIAHGGEVRFDTRISKIIIKNGEATGVSTEKGDIVTGPVILATGHSARDIYRMLHDEGVEIEAKGIAIGVRLEHPQKLIDSIQYHSPKGRGPYLPPAEYSFVTQADGRGVYSFCMCPGGVIVPAVSGPGQLVVNGMSASSRSSRWANSGMVVELHPGDFPEFADEGPLEMLALQESLEHKFFEESGKTLSAPAQLMKDFVESKDSSALPLTSYVPGIYPARIDHLLPPFIARRLQAGFRAFGRRSRGFLTNDAVLIGLESRTSSPVRIPRGEDMQHISIHNLYPAGEGAGYAGGIVSAAMDGIRCAEACFNTIQINRNNGNHS